MSFLSPPADRRLDWRPLAGLPDVWCATLETAYRAETGLSALLHCVRPEESKVSIHIHLRFGPVLAFCTTEHIVDPWQDDGASFSSGPISPRFCPPLQEVHPSSWLESLTQDAAAEKDGTDWRHFEIVSSDAVFHVISSGKLEAASYFEI